VISRDRSEALVLYAVDNFIDKFQIRKMNLTSLMWTDETIEYNEIATHVDVTSWAGYPEATRALNGNTLDLLLLLLLH
jgi:hypothetical protein